MMNAAEGIFSSAFLEQGRKPHTYRGLTVDDMRIPEIKPYETASPVYAPDWRWREARKMCEYYPDPTAYQISRSDDALLVKHVYPFFLKYANAKDDQGRRVLATSCPAIYWAWLIRKSGNRKTWLLEALICSGLTCGHISDLYEVPELHVWWYERIFFDVRKYLENRLWMLANVFVPLQSRRTDREELFIKVLGWNNCCEPGQLLSLLDPSQPLPPEAYRVLKKLIEKQMTLDAFKSSMSRELTPANESKVIEQYLRRESTKKVEENNAENEYEESLKALVSRFARDLKVASANRDFNGIEGPARDDIPDPAAFFASQARVKQEAII